MPDGVFELSYVIIPFWVTTARRSPAVREDQHSFPCSIQRAYFQHQEKIGKLKLRAPTPPKPELTLKEKYGVPAHLDPILNHPEDAMSLAFSTQLWENAVPGSLLFRACLMLQESSVLLNLLLSAIPKLRNMLCVFVCTHQMLACCIALTFAWLLPFPANAAVMHFVSLAATAPLAAAPESVHICHTNVVCLSHSCVGPRMNRLLLGVHAFRTQQNT